MEIEVIPQAERVARHLQNPKPISHHPPSALVGMEIVPQHDLTVLYGEVLIALVTIVLHEYLHAWPPCVSACRPSYISGRYGRSGGPTCSRKWSRHMGGSPEGCPRRSASSSYTGTTGMFAELQFVEIRRRKPEARVLMRRELQAVGSQEGDGE